MVEFVELSRKFDKVSRFSHYYLRFGFADSQVNLIDCIDRQNSSENMWG
jgi:hypothetical protein